MDTELPLVVDNGTGVSISLMISRLIHLDLMNLMFTMTRSSLKLVTLAPTFQSMVCRTPLNT